MSFLAKLKRKRGSSTPGSDNKPRDIPEQPQHEEETIVKSPEPVEVEAPSPTHPVEIASIFTGLKLSAQVASNEGQQSPYMQRSTPNEDVGESDNGDSSFLFLKQEVSVVSEDSPEITDNTSPFGFITSDSPENESSSFSFLNQQDAEVQSHDAEVRSHDKTPKLPSQLPSIVPGSHDQQSKSHDAKEVAQLSQTKHLTQTVTKQLAPKVVKKKRKAVRPGQTSQEDDVETLSLSSHTSSIDGSRVEDDTPLSPSPLPPQIDLSEDKESTKESHDQQSTKDGESYVRESTKESHDQESTKDGESHDQQWTKDGESHDRESTKDGESHDRESTKNGESHDQIAELVKLNSSDEPEVEAEVIPISTGDPGFLATELSDIRPNYEVQLTAQDKLTALLEGYESGLAQISVTLSSSVESVCRNVSAQVLTAQSQVEKRRLISELKAQQSVALSEEDYELAEQINLRLEETVLTREGEIADTCLKALLEWLVECCESDESEVTFRDDMQSKITSLKEEQTCALAELDKEHSSLLAKDKLKLQGMEDTIERERGHIALDREHLERRETLLNEEVHRRAAEFISKKDALQEELTVVQDEIAELEAKLSFLCSQRDAITLSISEEESKISSVEDELAGERTRLREERHGILTRGEQLTKEQENLLKEKDSLDGSHDNLKVSRESLAALVKRAQNVSDDFERKVECLKQTQIETDALLKLGEDGRTMLAPSDKLAKLLESVSKQSVEVDSLTSQVLTSQTDLSRLKRTLSDLAAQLPQLNHAKKAAVTGRQFKEASRIASELKTATSKIEEVKGQISTAESALVVLNKQLTPQSEELEAIKNETDTLEKEEDEAHLTSLLTQLDLLEEVAGRVDGSSLSGALKEWIKLYSLLADNLSVKHGLSIEDYKESPSSVDAITPEIERTPGVGKEEENTPTSVGEEVTCLEREIQEACDVEDYDLAAELEEKLNSLKTTKD